MKRSKFVQLSLTSAVALAIAGCETPEKQYQVSKTFSFDSVQQCTDQKIPVDVCSDAFMAAMAEHRRIAPTYKSQAECDADFVAGYCQVDSSGNFIPKLGGFTLATSGQVSQSQLDSVQGASGSSAGSGNSGINDMMLGLLIGNMLSSNSGRYYSEPVYRYRDDRGSFSTSTLSSRIARGATFKNSNQVKSGTSYQAAGSKKPAIGGQTITTKQVVAKDLTRGGFGKKAAARSGWGTGGSRS